MKHLLLLLCFIASYGVGTVYGQNLTQMVSAPPVPTIETANNSVNHSVNNSTATANDATVNLETPLVRVEVLGLLASRFKNFTPPPTSKSFLDTAREINDQALFQRRRFEETGQPIEIDRNHIYYRRDNYSYTKGIILWRGFGGKMDFGLYKSHFSPAQTIINGKFQPDFNQQDSHALLFRNGNRLFFRLRVQIPTP